MALSGGSVRGLAHIGVVKALTEVGIQPEIITGTSAGSLIGAALAAGMTWQDLADLARSVVWFKLLHGDTLEKFCAERFPETFKELRLPFAAIATHVPTKKVVTIKDGHLPSAISASCAMRGVRGAVIREGQRLKDGGIACVLPSVSCREMGADFVIGSDVWELSSLLRSVGIHPTHSQRQRIYPSHYRRALHHTDMLVTPAIPHRGYVPGKKAVELMIAAGEQATHQALKRLFIHRAA
ncbi:MAG: patatin-like phospholipase family protein [Acidobacteriota bacterium]